MANAMNDDEETGAEDSLFAPDIEVVPADEIDIEVVPEDVRQIEKIPVENLEELDIGSGLTLRFDEQYSEETYEQLEVLRQNPDNPAIRQRIADSFGPEMTAGVGIGLLIALFAVLMVVGVREPSDAESNNPVAPPAEVSIDEGTGQEIPDVQIGEPVTLERE